MGSWAYLGWLFTGYFTPGYSAVSQAVSPSPEWQVITPLYVGVGIVLALTAPRNLLAYAIPLVLWLLLPETGISVTESFTALFTLFAFAALPYRLHRTLLPVLLIAATVQIALVHFIPGDRTEQWWHVLNSPPGAPRPLDACLGEHLAMAPAESILADPDEIYRVIAFAGTAKPFVLPRNGNFDLVAGWPAIDTCYLLVREEAAAPSPLARYRRHPPAGMVLDARFSDYLLWRRRDVMPLIGDALEFEFRTPARHPPPRCTPTPYYAPKVAG